MKKFTLFLSALLISMVSMAAPLGEGYSKVTDITTLAAGDKVVLYCDDAELGVTGYNGNKDATVAATGWVEYIVETAEGGVFLKDDAKGQYVLPASKAFKYASEPSIACNVSSDGILYGVISEQNYYLYDNNGQYYRMYVDKSSDSKYKPFYVYEVTSEGGTTPDDGGETPDDGGETPEPTPDPENPEGVLTCAEAVAICEQVGSTATTEEYTVRGYVTSIKYSWNEQYGTATFWIADTKDGGDVLQAYSCAPLTDNDKVFAVGAYVELVGKLKKYNTTNEVEKGTYTIITPADNPVDPEQPETPDVETVGNGTEDNPFTVEDVIALNNTLSGKHYVKAYIVGQATGASFVDGLDLEAPFEGATNSDGSVATQGTNLAIASTLTPDTANIIPVQLPKNNLRNDFNLVEHPEMLGKQVLIYGELVKYFSLTGIKNPTSIVLVNTTETAVDNVTVNQNITKFFENGQLIIIKNGVKFNAQGQVVK